MESADFFPQYLKQGICGQVPSAPHFLPSTMAPTSDDNVKNIGSVHLTSLVILSNPRSCGTGPMSIVLDLHLLLKSPEGDATTPEGGAIEKIILAHLYNNTRISFVAPRVCFVSIGVCLPSPHSVPHVSDHFQ